MLKERGDLRPLSCDFGVECGGSVGMAMPEATWTGLGRGDGFGQRASGVGGAPHSLSLGSRCMAASQPPPDAAHCWLSSAPVLGGIHQWGD